MLVCAAGCSDLLGDDMGREVKRVPPTFNWPLNKTWAGFLHEAKNPKRAPRTCPSCDGSGYNRHTKRIADDFYDFAETGRRWCDRITQDEADALVREGRGQHWDGAQWVSVPRTAEEFNAANRQPSMFGLSHDAINRSILIKARAKRLGVYGECSRCRGDGTLFRRRSHRKRWERWQETPVPKGDGWQLWEMVSEGSPVSPVFPTADGLIDWLVSTGEVSRDAAAKFVLGDGWSPSGIGTPGRGFAAGLGAIEALHGLRANQ